MSDVVQSLRQALQDVLAPELREHRVLLTSLDAKTESVRSEQNAGIGLLRGELKAELGGLDAKIESIRAEFRAELSTVKLAVQSGFERMQHGLESAVLRGEVSTVRELADLRIRVERIEDHLKLRQDESGM